MADNDDVKKEEKLLIIPPDHTFGFYCRPANFCKIVSNSKLIFASWALLGYIIQFLLTITVINIYSDNDRKILCGGATTADQASAVYDIAFVLLGIYHLIEYFRFTIFMVACFLGVNLITLYYILGLNSLFGIAAYLVAHARRFNAAGKDCAGDEFQVYRGRVLIAEVVIFWTTFFIMSFPMLFLKFMSKQKVEKCYIGNASEEEEDSGENKE
jgi:hypothetical protein